MVYKRATKKLRDAGIEHIVITKGLYGAVPYDGRAKKQTSRCFDTWQDATTAVIDGYRPNVEEYKVEAIRNCSVCGKPVVKLYGGSSSAMKEELLPDAAPAQGQFYRCKDHPEGGSNDGR